MLPRVMLVCDYEFCGSTERWLEILETLNRRNWHHDLVVQVRIKNQSDKKYRQYAELAKSMLPSTVRTLLNGNARLASELGYDGVHLPQCRLDSPPPGIEELGWLSIAIHQTTELVSAESLGAHSIIVAPVFRPIWKDVIPLGLGQLRTTVEQSSVPIYALGGIDVANVKACLAQHVHGIAVLSSVLKARDPVQVLERYFDKFESQCLR